VTLSALIRQKRSQLETTKEERAKQTTEIGSILEGIGESINSEELSFKESVAVVEKAFEELEGLFFIFC
jgi:hypothetical protein